MRTLWIYLFQVPGTVIIWLARGCKNQLSVSYKKHINYSGFVGLAFDAGLVFLLFKNLEVDKLFNL